MTHTFILVMGIRSVQVQPLAIYSKAVPPSTLIRSPYMDSLQKERTIVGAQFMALFGPAIPYKDKMGAS